MVRRDVSGRYRGTRHGYEVALRVDVDGPRPTNRVSADYYRVSGREKRYVGSMRVDEPVVRRSAQQVTIMGTASFSMAIMYKRVKVTVARAPLRGAPAPATLRHLASPGVPGTVYECKFESSSFRTVDLEEARETGVTPPESYDTSELPSGGTPRKLTHVDAFGEAGVEMLSSGPPTVIDTSGAGSNATWSDAELQAAMQAHFTRWGNRPRWAIWLLHAASHDDERLAGLMFDQRGLQRQGCAVFYGYGNDQSPAAVRDELHTCVHELGHGFNLPHCWQKSLLEPPLPSRPEAYSWMNYPTRFTGGEAAFWPQFAFGFDDPELVFLRHAYETDVIMGGAPFGGRGTGPRKTVWDVDGPTDPGLRLKLSAPPRLAQDVPVTVGLELAATTRQGRLVPPVLGPRAGTVDIAIRTPAGNAFVFEPLLYHCRGAELVTLRAGDPPVRDYAFIHYGKRGFAFDRPGRYLVRARYAPPDGPIVLSAIASVRVTAPASRADHHVAELIGGDAQVGTLMSLMGSDAAALRRGNRRLTEIVARYPTHPVADVARLVQATNLARGFKRLDTDGGVHTREPMVQQAAALVADVVELQPSAGAPTVAPDELERLRAPEDLRMRVRITGNVDPTVDGFVNSRRREIEGSVPQVMASTRGSLAAPGANVPTRSPGRGGPAGLITPPDPDGSKQEPDAKTAPPHSINGDPPTSGSA